MDRELDISYSSLYNSITLQTDKKGFFLPYADNVTEILGEKWIENVFGKLKTDEERIKILFSERKLREVAHGPLDALQVQWRQKDPMAAAQARKEGVKALDEDRPRVALQLFSQAVIRAPSAEQRAKGKAGSAVEGELALALWARAEALERMKQHALAIKDLRAVDRIAHSAIPRFQVLWRMARSHRGLRQPRRACVALRAAQALLGAQQAQHPADKTLAHAARVLMDDLAAAEAALEDIPQDAPDSPERAHEEAPPALSGGEGPLPSASACVGVGEAPGAGRFAVAASPIGAGDVVLVEAPLAACLLPERFGSHCHHCMRSLVAPVACKRCAGLAFCGDACAQAAATYHDIECRLSDVLLASGMSILCRIALRLATQAPGGGVAFDAAHDEEVDAERASYLERLRRLDALVTHAASRPPSDMMQRALMALFLLKMLRKTDFFKGTQPPAPGEVLSSAELRLAALMLRWLQLLQFNAHEVYETRMVTPKRFRGAKPNYIGVAIFPSAALCNHDCYPALARFFVGTTLVLRALRPLRPGDVLAENYGPAFVKFPLAKRKRALISRYWFNCACAACGEDWPQFEGMDNSFRVRCPSGGCCERVPLSQDLIESSTSAAKKAVSVKCSGCHKRVNVVDALHSVQDAEKDYAQGLDLMEDGKAAAAIPLFCSYVDRLHQIGFPPKKNLHLCQEALRICMADAGNKWIASDHE